MLPIIPCVILVGPSSLSLGHCVPRFARYWAPLPSALRYDDIEFLDECEDDTHIRNNKLIFSRE